MTDLVEVDLGEAGRRYLAESFGGAGGLCKRMLPAVLSSGQVKGLIPAGTSNDRAAELATGGLVSLTVAERYLIARALKHEGVLLVQDPWAKPDDWTTANDSVKLWLCEREVYLWSALRSELIEKIRFLLRYPVSWKFIAFVLEDRALESALESGVATLDELATRVVQIYAPAYDRESFVIWTC